MFFFCIFCKKYLKKGFLRNCKENLKKYFLGNFKKFSRKSYFFGVFFFGEGKKNMSGADRRV